MSVMQMLEVSNELKLAYHIREGKEPGIVFLAGLKSNMEGTKALFLDDYCQRTNRAYLRFDYSGHGSSSGTFEKGSVLDWYRESVLLLNTLKPGMPQLLVGSSMGAWIGLKIVQDHPELVKGLIGVSSAPDFTEDILVDMDPEDYSHMELHGYFNLHTDYDQSITITNKMIEDGRECSLYNSPLYMPIPVRFLHAADDKDVSVDNVLDVLYYASGPDINLTIVKGEDHRFSSKKCLRLIENTIDSIVSTY